MQGTRAWSITSLAVCAAVLLGALAACSSSESGGSGSDGAPEGAAADTEVALVRDLTQLRTSDEGGRAHIVDGDEREVLLRGANLNQIGDYHQGNVDLVPTKAPTAADWDGMAAQGFSVVRLLVHWSLLEPKRGVWSKEYLATIRKAVDAAKARGIYTVIDFHQDAWGKYIATPKGTTCPEGKEPAIGWDGAPEWATLTDGADTCRPPGNREGSDAVHAAFTNFYRNTDGIRDEFVATVAKVAGEFAKEPAVAGYDLFNEPNQVLSVTESEQRYTELLTDLVTEVRAAEKAVDNRVLPHLLFVEPIVLFPLPGTMPTKGALKDPFLVFAPHNYAEVIGPKILTVEQTFDVDADTAAELGWPLWIGEFGIFSKEPEALAVLRRFAAAEDSHLSSGNAEWQWRQRCGDPHTVGTPGNTPTDQVIQLNLIDCPADTDAGPYTEALEILSRAYPRAAPGHLTKLVSNPATHELVVEGTRGSRHSQLVIWVPGTVRPAPKVTGLDRVITTKVKGGFYVTAIAEARSYTFRLPAR